MAERRNNSSTPAKMEKAKTSFYRVWAFIGVVAIAVGVLYLCKMLSTVMSMLLWIIIIVFCLRGLVAALAKRGMSRGLATTIAYLVMFAVLTVVGILLFSPTIGFSGQFSDLVNNLPAYANKVIEWGNDMLVKYAYLLDNATIRSWLDTAAASLATWASNFASKSAQWVVSIGGALVNSIVVICFALIIAFWILMGLPQLGAEMKRLIGPRYAEDANLLSVTATRVVGGYIKATLIQCGIIGLCSGIICGVFGMRNPAAWGVIVGLLTIIPVVGPWIGGILAGVAGVFVAPWVGLVVFSLIVVVERIVMTFVSPLLLKDTVDIHPVMTLTVLMIGMSLGSALGGLGGAIVGMLICVPLVAAMKALFVYYFEKRTGRQIVSEDGYFFKGVPTDTEHFDPAADAAAAAPVPQSENTFAARLPILGNWWRDSDADDVAPEDDGEDDGDGGKGAVKSDR